MGWEGRGACGLGIWGWQMDVWRVGCGWFVRGVAASWWKVLRAVICSRVSHSVAYTSPSGDMGVVWQRQRQKSRCMWFVDCDAGRISRSASWRVRFDV